MQSHDHLVTKLMARPGVRAEVDRLEREPRRNDTRVTESSGNVFVDLGFGEAEAKVMALRVELTMRFLKPPVSTHIPQSTNLPVG